MANNEELLQPQAVYNTICTLLHERGYRIDPDPQRMLITFNIPSKVLSMDCVIRVEEDGQFVRLMFPLPFTTAQDKMFQLSIAVDTATYNSIDGFFKYDVTQNVLVYELNFSYRYTKLTGKLLSYMILTAKNSVESYFPPLRDMNLGKIDLVEFMRTVR